MLIKTLSYVFVMLLPLSCGVKHEAKKDKKMTSNFSETASKIVIGENELVLDCLLWMNLMPTIGKKKNSPPLLGSVKLRDKNGKMLPDTLQLKKVYFVQGDTILESNFSETRQKEDTEIEGEGKSYQIASRGQQIGKVH